MRTGDFSELLPLGVQIYDPATARLVNGVVTRDPFPGQHHPGGRINPIARNVLGYFPAAQQAPAADLSQNFFIEQPWTYGYNFAMTRIDHEWTRANAPMAASSGTSAAKSASTSRAMQNGTEITRGVDRPVQLQLGGRAHRCAVADHGARPEGQLAAIQRRSLPALQPRPREPRLSRHRRWGCFGDFEQLPRFSIESAIATTAGRVATLGAQQSGFNSGRTQPFYNVQFAPTLTKTTGGTR